MGVELIGCHCKRGHNQSPDEEESVVKSRGEILREAHAIDEEESGLHQFRLERRWSKKKEGKC